MMRLVGILVTVLCAIGTAILVWPQFFQLEQTFPITQLIAMRGLLVVGFGGVAILALLLMFSRKLRGFAASILIIAVLGGVATAGTLALRGVSGGALPDKVPGSIRVMTWNTAGEAVPAETIAASIVDQQADVIALPETAESVGERIAIMLREQGRPMWVHHVQFNPGVENGPQAWETTILISPDLGDYSVIASSVDGTSNTSSVPSAVVMPVDGTGPTIVAVHAVAPRESAMERWRSDLQWIANQCPEGDFILAGDFNATTDHMASLGVDGGTIGRCHDAAIASGTGGIGTWPAWLPDALGAPIDHVMASANWTPAGTVVLTAEGSDHRALVAQLDPAG